MAKAAVANLAHALTDQGLVELAETALRSLRAVELQVARLRGLDDPRTRTLDRRPVDLVELARQLIDDLDITLLHDHPTHLEGVDALVTEIDADQLRQVIYNLLSNAAKYSPRGRTIIVSITASGRDAQLDVHDQGEGVAPEDADRIFERYERVGDEQPGAGLGLYLAREIVRAHGGELELVPAQGEGSTFRVTLPVRA